MNSVMIKYVLPLLCKFVGVLINFIDKKEVEIPAIQDRIAKAHEYDVINNKSIKNSNHIMIVLGNREYNRWHKDLYDGVISKNINNYINGKVYEITEELDSYLEYRMMDKIMEIADPNVELDKIKDILQYYRTILNDRRHIIDSYNENRK